MFRPVMQKIKIAFLVPTLDGRAAGITTVVDSISECLGETGLVEARKFAPEDVRGFASLGSSASLVKRVREYQPDVLHTHGLWVAHARAGARLALLHRVPEVVSPHGMLDPWALGHHAWKKRLAWWLVERRHLAEARVIHSSVAEVAAIRAKGVRRPVAVIPNGIKLPSDSSAGPPPWSDVFDKGAKVLLFLARLHPKKGVTELIRAWAGTGSRLVSDGWRLALLGWEEEGHGAVCEALIRELGVESTCRWFGPANERVKAAAAQNASAFILPSFSEGLPMMVLEAWAHRLPVLMTRACNLPDGFEAGAAIEISNDPTRLAAQLIEALGSENIGRLSKMGRAGRELVEERFTAASVARQFLELYQWMLGQAPQPEFVLESPRA